MREGERGEQGFRVESIVYLKVPPCERRNAADTPMRRQDTNTGNQ